MKKSTLRAIAVTFFSLGGAAFCAHLLYQDLYFKKTNFDGLEQAGLITDKRETVKRKLGEAMVWDPIESQDKLFWNDAIQTAKKSQVTIKLNDGTNISLGESSLVVLERDQNQLSLNLKSGQVLLAAADGPKKQTAQIKINGVTIEQKNNSSMSLQFDSSKEKLVATTSDQSGTAKQITIDKQGRVEEKELAAVLQNPPPLAHFLTDSNSEPTSFSWQAKNQDQILEIAQDQSFRNVYRHLEVTTSQAVVDLPPGQYYWRLKPKTKENLTSETRSFDIVQMQVPQGVAPEMDKVVTYRSDVPTIEFSWKGDSAVSHYFFEISPTEDFSNPILKEKTNKSYLRTSKVNNGRQYWRVVAVYGDKLKSSSSRVFELKQIQEAKPPTLLAPEKSFTVTYEFFNEAQGIPFKWKVESPDPHRFVLSKSDSLAEPLVSFESTLTETLVTEKLSSGSYFWSVGYKNSDGEWKYKEIRKIILGAMTPPPAGPNLRAPASLAELDLLKDPLIKWQWEGVEGAKEYKFKLFKVSGQKLELVLEDTLNELEKQKKDLPDGNYKWTVSAIDHFGRESKPVTREMRIFHGVTLEAPEIEMEEVQ